MITNGIKNILHLFIDMPPGAIIPRISTTGQHKNKTHKSVSYFLAPRVRLELTTLTVRNMVVHLTFRSLNSLLQHLLAFPASPTGRGQARSISETSNFNLTSRTYTKQVIVQNLF